MQRIVCSSVYAGGPLVCERARVQIIFFFLMGARDHPFVRAYWYERVVYACGRELHDATADYIQNGELRLETFTPHTRSHKMLTQL